MAILVRFQTGSLKGRAFEVDAEVVRIGDAEDADIRVDPTEPDNAGARDRVIEVFRDGKAFRIHSIGNRDISAQGETAIDRRVEPDEDVRFSAWGPIFTVALVSGTVANAESITAKYKAPAPSKAKAPAAAPAPAATAAAAGIPVSLERPVGPKTVHMMIQDALGKARGTDGGTMVRGTVFVRSMVHDTIHSATRSLKIGLALMGGAVIILAAVLIYNISTTKQTLNEMSEASDRRVSGVKAELTGELMSMKQERDKLVGQADALKKKLEELEKTQGGEQKAVAELRSKVKEAEEQRKSMDEKLARAMSAASANNAQLKAELDRLDRQAKAQAAEAERKRIEQEKTEADARAKEAAAREAAAKEAAARDAATTSAPAPANSAPK